MAISANTVNQVVLVNALWTKRILYVFFSYCLWLYISKITPCVNYVLMVQPRIAIDNKIPLCMSGW